MVASAIELAEITTRGSARGSARSRTNWARSRAICSSIRDDVDGAGDRREDRHARKRAEAAALAADPRITNSEGASFDSHSGTHVFANSRGFVGEYRTSYCSLSAAPVAQRRRLHGARLLVHAGARVSPGWKTPEDVGRMAAERALRRLGARKVETQKVPVVFEPRTARSLLDHIFEAVHGDVDLPARVLSGRQAGREDRGRDA